MPSPSMSISSDTLAQVPGLLSDAAAVLHSDLWEAQRMLARALEMLSENATTYKTGGGLTAWQIRRIDTYIRDHLTSRIQSRDLAAVVKLSMSHFSHAFRRTFDETPLNYVARQRIARAQYKLRTHQTSLSEIALDCGFCDQSHFSRVFHRLTGMSPKAWQGIYTEGPVNDIEDMTGIIVKT